MRQVKNVSDFLLKYSQQTPHSSPSWVSYGVSVVSSKSNLCFSITVTILCYNGLRCECYYHDDVIKWKHSPRYWPFVREIHWSPMNSPHKGQWYLWCFLWSSPEQTVEQTIETPVIWDTITLIMTSLISRLLLSPSHKQTHTSSVKYECFCVFHLSNVIFLPLCGLKYIHVHVYMSKTEVYRNGSIHYSFWAQDDVMTWKCFLYNWAFVMGNH